MATSLSPELSARLSDLMENVAISQRNPEDDNLQEEVLGSCVSVLSELPKEIHLFCNDDVRPVTLYALLLFSYESSESLERFKVRINNNLSTCYKCIRPYHIGKVHLFKRCINERGMSPEHVNQFAGIISDWELNRINSAIAIAAEKCLECEKDGKNITMTMIPKHSTLALYECLCDPELLRKGQTRYSLHDKFYKVFFGLQTNNKFLKLSDGLIPALLSFLFEEGVSPEIRRWTLLSLGVIKKKVTAEEFDICLQEEFQYQLIRIQSPPCIANQSIVKHFWLNMSLLLDVVEDRVIIDILSKLDMSFISRNPPTFAVFDVLKLMCNQILIPGKSDTYAAVLKGFKYILEAFGTEIWPWLNPLKPTQFYETIMSKNSKFSSNLTSFADSVDPIESTTDSTNEGLKPEPVISAFDFIDWIEPFIASLKDVQQQQQRAVAAISDTAFAILPDDDDYDPASSETQISSSISNTLMSYILKAASKMLSMDDVGFNDNGLQLNRMLRVDVLNVVNKYHDSVFSFALYKSADSPILKENRTTAISIIKKVLQIDVRTLCNDCIQLQQGKSTKYTVFKPEILLSLRQQPIRNDEELSRAIFESIVEVMNITEISVPESINNVSTPVNQAHNSKDTDHNKHTEELGKEKINLEHTHAVQFNKHVNELLIPLHQVLLKISESSPNILSGLLSNEETIEALFACMASSSSLISQTARDLLYQTFDAAGSLEGMKELLSNKFEISLKAFSRTLKKTFNMRLFSPFPKLIKIQMDMVTVLLDPQFGGILTNPDTFQIRTTSERYIIRKYWKRTWRFLNVIFADILKWTKLYPSTSLIEFMRNALDLSIRLLNGLTSFIKVLNVIEDFTEEGINLLNIQTPESLISDIFEAFPNLINWLRFGDELLLSSCVEVITTILDKADIYSLSISTKILMMLLNFSKKSKFFKNKLTAQQCNEIISKVNTLNHSVIEDNLKIPTQFERPISPSTLSDGYNSGRDSKEPSLKRKATTQPFVPSSRTKIKRFANDTPNQTPGSSSEDDSEIEDINELFGVSKNKNRKKIQMIDSKALDNGKSIRMSEGEIEERNMRERLNVSLNPLYSSILKWDYLNKSEFPSSDESNSPSYLEVADVFDSCKDYQKVFGPLLLLECWQGIMQSKEIDTDNKPFKVTIGNRGTADEFFDVYTSIKTQVLRDERISDSDLVVLAVLKDEVQELANKQLSGDKKDDSEQKSRFYVPVSGKELQKQAKVCSLAKVRDIKLAGGGSSDLIFRIDCKSEIVNHLSQGSGLVVLKIMK